MTSMKTVFCAVLAISGLTFVQSVNATLPKQPCHDDKCSDKATLKLSGVVETKCDLKVTPKTEATKLNITGGETNTSVATVTEYSNHLPGYKVTLRSTNGGALVHNSVPSEKVNYKLSYDGGSYVSPTTTPQAVKNSGPLGAPTTDNSDVRINFPAKPAALSGTYSDTVTFEISSL